MTWYRSWYLPLKRKLFLSKKLRWRFYLASRSLYLQTTQIRQNASRPSICQLYIPTKLFQNVRIICHNNAFCYIYNLSSVDHTTSLTCSYCNVLNFFGQVVIQKIRSSYCLKDKIITSNLHLFFQLFTEVLINVNFGYFAENFLIADDAPNVNGWFPTSLLTFSGIPLWYFFGLPCDLSISFTANLNSSFVISFVAEETNFVTIISSAF